MKKLHKKIGALALACMVAAGGFAASGIKVYAAPKSQIEDLNRFNQRVYYDVRDIIKEVAGNKNVDIFAAFDKKGAMNSYLRKNMYFVKRRKLDYLLVPHSVHGGSRILKIVLSQELGKNQRFFRFDYDDVDFLIEIRK